MWLADAEKNVPDPPSTLSALPKGVSTESSATEPTTRTVRCGRREAGSGKRTSFSHSLRGRDSQEIQTVAKNELRRACKDETRAHQRLGFVQHVRLVIPEVDLARGVVKVRRHPMR